ncbi:hypothetical protein VPH35_058198 [Triticum aestivum]
MMSTATAPFVGPGISVFSSFEVALMSTASDSFCMSGMEPKFEHTSMVFSNLELELELMAMERRKVDSERREGIEKSNEMGTEVLPAVDNKGKQPLHPMPDEVVLPPTAEKTLRCLRVTLDQGWATYAAVHQIKIGYMVAFKLLTPDTLKVIIFDDDGIEVVNKCGKHDEAFAAKD